MAKIRIQLVVLLVILANLSAVPTSQALTVQTNNGNTLQVNLAATRTLGSTDTSTDFDFSTNISRPNSGWNDSDLIVAEVAITSGTGATAGADNAPVFRDDSTCIVDLSNNINSNDFGSTQANSVTISSNTVFVLNDRTPQLSVQGTIQAVINVLSRVRVQCGTASALVGKYVRVGVVPTISSSDCTSGSISGSSATISCTDLYYVFSSQHYYRVGTASANQSITQHFARARTMTIPVDGTNKTGATRYGWVATLKDRDEITLTNAIDSGTSRMIGTTDRTNTGANAWTWDSNWGGSGNNCATDEGDFRWLGPDVWCERVPTWNHRGTTSYPSGTSTTSRYWIRTNNLWEPTDQTSYSAHTGMRIDFASTTTPTSEADARGTNGYNVFHSWHTAASGAPDEPNSSGDYIYQGYAGGNNNPGWDDAGESTGSEASTGATTAGQKFYVEFCSGTTGNTCTPPDAAVDSIQLKYDQSITLVTAPAADSSVSTSTTTFNATSSSGLALTYTSSDTSVCTVSSATAASGVDVTVSLVSANTNCTITISQDGNVDYNAATSVSRTFLSLFGRVVSCSGVGSLQNGGFENLPVTTSDVATANGQTNYVWHGYNGNNNNEPRQFLFLGAANSNKTTKISDWNASIVGSDDGTDEGWVEIQRQVSGYAQNGNFTTGAYYDQYNPAPAQGNYFAELNAKVVMGLYQDIATIPGTTIRWSIKHRGRSFTGADVMKVKIGSTSSQSEQTSLQKKLQETSSLWGTPTYGNNSFSSVSTISDELDTGWSEYKGAYTIPASQTTTRFIFESVSGAISSSIGNYLDDIVFSPLIACPATFSVIKGRTTTINPFDLDGDGVTDSGDSYGWSDATISASNLSASAGTVTRTTIGGVANRGISYTAPDSTGTRTIDFTITNPDGDTSNSRLTINVIDDTEVRSLNTLPIDPQATSYNPKNMTITSGPTQVLACLNIASDNTGTPSDGVLRIDVGNIGSSDSTFSASGNTVTITSDRSSAVNITGVLASVNTTLRTTTITRVSGGRLSGTYYIRIRSVPTSADLLNVTCSDASASSTKTFTLRPMSVGRTRSVSVSLNKR